MVREVIDFLRGCSHVLDCTLGGGGHSQALLDAGVSSVTGIDRDPEAIRVASERLATYGDRFHAVSGDFTRIDDITALHGVTFDGILADLGVSSHQLNDDERGFSFRPGVSLDMRMAGEGETAAEWLNTTPEPDLATAFREYGDEPQARRLASEIVRRRSNRPFEISDDLVGAIRAVLGPRSGPSDFARLFQAVRIAVNNELAGLDRALPLLRDRLSSNGVLAIMSYHSGEDRRVKQAFRAWSTACTCPPKQPVCTCGGVALGSLMTRKAVVASPEEAERNPRARSAKLRVWRKNA
jgi:16S rRNA (cytosine1402-N4)-methyltransferase